MNLVVAPWPLFLKRSQFAEETNGNLKNMPSQFRFLRTELEDRPADAAKFAKDLLSAARPLCDQVDGFIFPEVSLTPAEFEAVWKVLEGSDAFLVAGVLESVTSGAAINKVVTRMPIFGSSVTYEQRKHHRWRLDRPQVETYGLDSHLNPDCEWWEYIEVGRDLHFHPLNQDVTFCCLICEDLARLEPVGELVRSVGPNLVIALLMDAPQLKERWPARYATVLADDPGSSVLTVTSAGMVNLASPPVGMSRRRTIALWKDAESGITEIDLPPDAPDVHGALLRLTLNAKEEFSADGRSDGGVSQYPRLASWRPLRV